MYSTQLYDPTTGLIWNRYRRPKIGPVYPKSVLSDTYAKLASTYVSPGSLRTLSGAPNGSARFFSYTVRWRNHRCRPMLLKPAPTSRRVNRLSGYAATPKSWRATYIVIS